MVLRYRAAPGVRVQATVQSAIGPPLEDFPFVTRVEEQGGFTVASGQIRWPGTSDDKLVVTFRKTNGVAVDVSFIRVLQ